MISVKYWIYIKKPDFLYPRLEFRLMLHRCKFHVIGRTSNVRRPLVFSQIMANMPWKTVHRIVGRDKGDHRIRSCRCPHQYRARALAQRNRRRSVRDLVIGLRAHRETLDHLRIPNGVSRTTLAKAHETRDWRLDADDAYPLMDIAKPLSRPARQRTETG